jgi:hypothetical protein
MTIEHQGNERVWSEWLALYVEHCRRELDARELAQVADALELGVAVDGEIELDSLVAESVVGVARPLVDFIVSAESARSRARLSDEAATRLRAPAQARRRPA